MFIYLVMVKYVVQTGKHEVFDKWVGHSGPMSLYHGIPSTWFDFMAPGTCIITVLQCPD